ncbi:MAG: ABC transporter permease [Candidatus Tectimicrobiota bacterium]|nr:MAG: ABC transporter permease [Candidatus Tectomicrobia bacterium]
MRRLWRGLSPAATVYGLLLAWEGVCRAGLVTPFLLPAPSAIAWRLGQQLLAGDLAWHLALSLYRTLVSFALALLIAVPLGLAMGRVRGVRWFCEPLLAVGFPAPKIVFVQVFMLWFGLHELPKIAMATLEGIFPILSATYLGALGVDRSLLWSARNLGTGEVRLLWKVVLPAALPQVLNGAQIALPICFIVVFVTEMLLGGGGLGDAMMLAQRFADSRGVFAGIVTVSLLGYGTMRVVAWTRRLLLHWHVETQVRQL